MAKGKSANPMDAYRKAQRKKELKKNKAERAKTRDFALVKKDTRDLEDEITKLESASDPSASDRSRLAELKLELEKIVKKKEEYVQEHPEQRKLVFKSRRPHESRDETKESTAPRKRNLFKKNGLPRHPERSIYYDPVMNPFGVPPPGMPYIERALMPHEVDSDAEPESDDDDDIVMPEGPPPDQEEEDSDDDIPMPEGPPPPRPGDLQASLPPPLPIDAPPFMSPPLPGGLPIPHLPPPPSGLPPPPSGLPPLPLGLPMVPPPPPPGMPPPSMPPGSVTSPPPPPLGFPIMISPLPPPPPGFPMMPGPTLGAPPPPPPGFPPFNPSHLHVPIPAPPPGFYPRRGNSGSIQDPLSSIPHQTFQAHRAARAAGHQKATSGGVRLSTAGSPPAPAPAVSAVISAEPELRDFKKESTAFVPAALKRKRGGAGSKVNAAPTVGPIEDNDGEVEPTPVARPDLLSALQDKFGAPPPRKKEKTEPEAQRAPAAKPKDDYEKFLEEMGDVLGPSMPAK